MPCQKQQHPTKLNFPLQPKYCVPHVGVIINPNSRGNRSSSNRVMRMQRAIGPHGSVCVTANVAELAAVLRQWLDMPVSHLFADGGDGTLHWVIRTCAELLSERHGAEWHAHLPILVAGSSGTINFAADYLNTSQSSVKTLRRLRTDFETQQPGSSRSLQLMEVAFKQRSGETIRCHAFVIGIGGIAGNFFAQYYEQPKPSLATALRIIVHAVVSLPLSSRRLDRLLQPTRARVIVDDDLQSQRAFNSIHAATIPINLKMLKLFSLAGTSGGIQLLLGSATRRDVYRNIFSMIKGKALSALMLNVITVKKFSVDVQEQDGCLIVIDGEIIENVIEATIRLGPSLRFAVGD